MLLFAHRGFHGRTRTENTLQAFHEAVTLGADGIELDLRLSKDGELVVVHDKNLHRIAGDAHRVDELTAEELSRVSLRNGGSIVTLNEVTGAIHAPTQLDIEVKDLAVVDALIRKLSTSASLRERAIISSFHAKVLTQVQAAHPTVRTLQLMLRWPLPLRGEATWARLRKRALWGVGFPLLVLTEQRVAFLRQFWHVGTWDQRYTVAEARKAVQLGVDVAILHRIREARQTRSV